MTIGERIKNRRKELHMTQDDLAQKLNKTNSSVCKVERDKEQNLTIDRVKEYAAALDCTPAYLMGWTEYPSEDLFPSDDTFPSDGKELENAERQKKLDQLTQDELQLVDNLINTLYAHHC